MNKTQFFALMMIAAVLAACAAAAPPWLEGGNQPLTSITNNG